VPHLRITRTWKECADPGHAAVAAGAATPPEFLKLKRTLYRVLEAHRNALFCTSLSHLFL
jgi:hypothetical protein